MRPSVPRKQVISEMAVEAAGMSCGKYLGSFVLNLALVSEALKYVVNLRLLGS